jgi:glycosyltransferase involved in cell wall biosynthesis
MMIDDSPLVSVVMSTHNRERLLHNAISSVLNQRRAVAPTFELIVVDNNSTDDTRDVVERFANADRRVRYVFEPQQGSSYGRNAGIRAARAPLIAFTDDDVRAEPDWVEAIVRAFHEHAEADVVGGRVLPIWPCSPPPWVTREHWMPLALVDYGDTPVVVTADNPLCLVGANVAFRRKALEVVGGFAPDFQLGAHGILGSVEDHELQLRILRTGRTMVYDPRITVHADIQPGRLERAYHRRWHTGHGYFHGLLRSEEMEETRVGTLFGVPAHLYRQALEGLVGWARATAMGDRERAFRHELRFRFFWGFFPTRGRQFFQKPRLKHRDALWRLLRLRMPRREPLTQRADTGVGHGH